MPCKSHEEQRDENERSITECSPHHSPRNFLWEIERDFVATRYRKQSAASSPPTPSSSASTLSTSPVLRSAFLTAIVLSTTAVDEGGSRHFSAIAFGVGGTLTPLGRKTKLGGVASEIELRRCDHYLARQLNVCRLISNRMKSFRR